MYAQVTLNPSDALGEVSVLDAKGYLFQVRLDLPFVETDDGCLLGCSVAVLERMLRAHTHTSQTCTDRPLFRSFDGPEPTAAPEVEDGVWGDVVLVDGHALRYSPEEGGGPVVATQPIRYGK